MKPVAKRAVRVARVVIFLGCGGAVFAQNSWVRSVSRDLWSYSSSEFANRFASAPANPNANSTTVKPWSADAAGDSNLAGQQMDNVLRDLLFSSDLARGSYFPASRRSSITATTDAADFSSMFASAGSADSSSLAPKFDTITTAFGESRIAATSIATTRVAPSDVVMATTPDKFWQGDTGTPATPSSGFWSSANAWTPSGAPVSSDTTTLGFGGIGSTPYTSTNDLGTFAFREFVLTSTATVTETINGDTLQLPTTGTGTITQNGSGAFVIANNVTGEPTSAAPFYSTLALAADSVAGTGTVTLSGTISDGFRHVSLTKSGPNTAILTGANTYSGGTQIDGGTLLVNNTSGSGTGSGLVSVNSGGTLGGTGTITVVATEGQAQVNVYGGGTVVPGNGPNTIGQLTLNNLQTNFGPSSKLLIDLNATTSDLLATTSFVNIVSGATIDFNQLATPTADSYRLVTYTNHFGAFTPINLPAGYDLVYTSTELDLVAVPEPATWAMAGLASIGCVGVTLRRRRRAVKA